MGEKKINPDKSMELAPAEGAALVPQGVTAVVIPEEPNPEWQYLPEGELLTPRIKILQKAEEGHDKPGVFVNNLTGEETDILRCVIVAMRRSRTLFPKPFRAGGEPLCKSVDFENGVGTPGGLCCRFDEMAQANIPVCPKAMFGQPGARDDGTPPECSEAYDFVGYDVSGNPFVFSVHGASLKPARAFITAAQRRRKPLFYTGAEITLEKRTDKGLYYVAIFKRVGETPVEDWEALSASARGLLGALARVASESPANNEPAAAAEY